MERNIELKLLEWKNSSNRKPLLLQGARQVGKTYSLKKFGKEHFKNYFIFDFMLDSKLKTIFKKDLNPKRIIQDLSLYIDKDINSSDLIIFDEIQECGEAITSLKYFNEQYPEAFICASGSLLGTGLNNSSFPVGKIDRLKLYPMDFFEFLHGTAQHKLLNTIIEGIANKYFSEILHQKAWHWLKLYFITGGLPEVITTLISHLDNLLHAFNKVRKLQKSLIQSYKDDITKHSGKLKAVRIEAIFKNIPMQLAKENKSVNKFVFKDVLTSNSKYIYLEGPIEWLLKAGLIHNVYICNNAAIPLQAYSKSNRFKLYLFDIGILGAMTNLDPKAIYEYEYGSYKEYFAENYVLNEIICKLETDIFSWAVNTSELELLLEHNDKVIPIEVKAGINTKAKSLNVYKSKYNPDKSILFSALPYKETKSKLLAPLYLACSINELI